MVEPEETECGDKTLEHYELMKKLGDGTFGIGYLAKDTQSELICCVKVFKEMDQASDKTFRAEVEAGQTGLNHPNVLRLLGAGRSQVVKAGDVGDDVFYIVSEIAENGEAFDFVEAADGLDEPYARQLFAQLISAVEYIHKKGIAHRDLKLENCFLTKNVLLKVADFGMQKIFDGPNGQTLTTKLGTPNYMAPELLSGDDEAYEGPPVDTFACGVILFIMCFGKFPFSEAGDIYYRRMHKDPVKAMAQRKIKANPEFLDLVVGLTTADPSKRYTLAQVKSHPWFQGPIASPEDVKAYFYDLQHETKAADEEQYTKMQEERAHFAQTSLIERGSHDSYMGPTDQEIQSWSELEYKTYCKGIAGTTGFFANTIAQHLFIALWEHIYTVYKVVPALDDCYWKMNITLEEPLLEPIELEEGEEEEDIPMRTVDIVAKVEDRGENVKPRYFMSFRRKMGDAGLFSKFVKRAMGEKLQMFCEKVE